MLKTVLVDLQITFCFGSCTYYTLPVHLNEYATAMNIYDQKSCVETDQRIRYYNRLWQNGKRMFSQTCPVMWAEVSDRSLHVSSRFLYQPIKVNISLCYPSMSLLSSSNHVWVFATASSASLCLLRVSWLLLLISFGSWRTISGHQLYLLKPQQSQSQ